MSKEQEMQKKHKRPGSESQTSGERRKRPEKQPRPKGVQKKRPEGQRSVEETKRKRPAAEPQKKAAKKNTLVGAYDQMEETPKRSNSDKKKPNKKTSEADKGTNQTSNIILAIAILVFLFSGFQLIKSVLPYFQGGAEYDDIKALVIEQDDSEVAFQVDFARLLEINSDTVAWIRFDKPETISYPVVQGEDNSRYLTATFQANDNKLGAIFVDYRNSPGFSDRNTIIYGHNMKIGGEMFSQLLEYKDKSFYEENPYFYIYTPDGQMRTYQIFSAGIVADSLDNYMLEFESDEEFEEYLELCKKHSAYDTGVEVDADSKIVSLSTCTNVRDDERYLVQGVLVEDVAEE